MFRQERLEQAVDEMQERMNPLPAKVDDAPTTASITDVRRHGDAFAKQYADVFTALATL